MNKLFKDGLSQGLCPEECLRQHFPVLFLFSSKKTEDVQCTVPQTSKSVGVSQKAGGFGVVPWATGVPPPLPSAFPLSPPPRPSLGDLGRTRGLFTLQSEGRALCLCILSLEKAPEEPP